jgi:hypothetical protein
MMFIYRNPTTAERQFIDGKHGVQQFSNLIAKDVWVAAKIQGKWCGGITKTRR